MNRLEYKAHLITAAFLNIIDSLVIIVSLGFLETNFCISYLTWKKCQLIGKKDNG